MFQTLIIIKYLNSKKIFNFEKISFSVKNAFQELKHIFTMVKMSFIFESWKFLKFETLKNEFRMILKGVQQYNFHVSTEKKIQTFIFKKIYNFKYFHFELKMLSDAETHIYDLKILKFRTEENKLGMILNILKTKKYHVPFHKKRIKYLNSKKFSTSKKFNFLSKMLFTHWKTFLPW